MVGCHGLSSRNSEACWRTIFQRQLKLLVKPCSKMAASGDDNKSAKKINLRPFGMEDETERGSRFWNNSSVEMKFTIEKEWIKLVRFARDKPNYGMRNLDPVLEELTGNKLELVGPMLDGFIREIGSGMSAKLGRSRMTGLMTPFVLFMPFQIFKHLWVIVQGYGGNAETSKKGEKITLTISTPQTAAKIWSPARFSGENFLAKRHFEKIPENGRVIQHYNGKSLVVVTQATPIKMDFSVKQQRVTTTFYVQRYDRNDFAKDTNLQRVMNEA